MIGVGGVQSIQSQALSWPAPKPQAQAGGGGADFGAILQDLAANTVETMKAGEAAAIEGIEGKMPVQQTVEAVLEAEKTFQTAVAIRDKIVSAYLEISRMQI
jgi:flagellar hook-basal body complex protein FliE